MTSTPLDNLVRIGKLKAEPPAQGDLDVDDALVVALIRVAKTVAGRVAELGPVGQG